MTTLENFKNILVLNWDFYDSLDKEYINNQTLEFCHFHGEYLQVFRIIWTPENPDYIKLIIKSWPEYTETTLDAEIIHLLTAENLKNIEVEIIKIIHQID